MASVLLIIFNRINTTQLVFNEIRRAQPSRLYIAADGPRPGIQSDIEKCMLVRAITENIDWPCSVERLYQTNNLGCSQGPISAFRWFFSLENEGIILEDDCLPSETFFPFCEELLQRYRYNEKVMLISGCNLGYNSNTEYSYEFSGIPNMWGWATWKRSAILVDYQLSDWKNTKYKLIFSYKYFRTSIFDTDLNWYRYWVHKFDLTVDQKLITWWDWQWIYYQRKYRKVSIFPAINLIKNIGFNYDATHTKDQDNPAADLEIKSIQIPLNHPKAIKRNNDYEENYIKWKLFYHKRLPWHFHLQHSVKIWLLNKFKSNKNLE